MGVTDALPAFPDPKYNQACGASKPWPQYAYMRNKLSSMEGRRFSSDSKDSSVAYTRYDIAVTLYLTLLYTNIYIN
jgi:hypothetical protein